MSLVGGPALLQQVHTWAGNCGCRLQLHPPSTGLGTAARSLQGAESLSLTSAGFGAELSKAVCLSWAALQGKCFQMKSGLSFLHIFCPTKRNTVPGSTWCISLWDTSVQTSRQNFDRIAEVLSLPGHSFVFILRYQVISWMNVWNELKFVFLSCLQNIPWRLRAFVFTSNYA